MRMRTNQRRQSSFAPLPAMAKQVVDLALDLRDASTSASSTSIDMG
jgi:hypothetical protein